MYNILQNASKVQRWDYYSKIIKKVKSFVVFDGKCQLLHHNYADNLMLTESADCGWVGNKIIENDVKM